MEKNRCINSSAKILMLALTIIVCQPALALANKTAPEFQFQAINTSETIHSRAYQGTVMLVNFWATWCPPCRKEIPSLIKLQNEFHDQGFTVIGISVDQDGNSGVKKFADKMGINYPVGQGSTEIAKNFGPIAGIPASFLINRKGDIVKSYPGYATHEQLKKDIEELINP